MILTILFLALALMVVDPCQGAGFFSSVFGGGSSSSAGQKFLTEPTLIRGVPDSYSEKYLLETFSCDDDKTKIGKGSVNDGYCDCSDGSDEPGTSACPKSTFACVNKGFRVIKIPSSRVDDTICDCCDGSDEGNLLQCPNTCAEIAEKEKAALEHISKSFRIGHAKRNEYIKAVRERAVTSIAEHKKLTEEIESGTAQLEVLRTAMDIAVEKELKEWDVKEMEVDKKIHNFLGTTDLSLSQLLHYLTATFDSLGQTDESVKILAREIQSKSTTTKASTEELDEGLPETTEDVDEEIYGEGGDDVDLDAVIENPTSDVSSVACPSLSLRTEDSRLTVLCSSNEATDQDLLTTAKKLLIKVSVRHYFDRAFQLVVGYHMTQKNVHGIR